MHICRRSSCIGNSPKLPEQGRSIDKVSVRIILGYFDPQLLQNPAGIFFQPDIQAQFLHGSFEAKPDYQILQLLRRITALMCTLKDLPTHNLQV